MCVHCILVWSGFATPAIQPVASSLLPEQLPSLRLAGVLPRQGGARVRTTGAQAASDEVEPAHRRQRELGGIGRECCVSGRHVSGDVCERVAAAICPQAELCILQVASACTLHHAPCTLHLASCTLHLAPCILHLAPCSLYLATYTLHLAPYTLHIAAET